MESSVLTPDGCPIVEAANLFYAYEKETVLEGVTFTLRTGDYVGIVGPNGGGKTTLLKLILGLLKPTAGYLKVFGTDAAIFTQRYRFGYVPQRASSKDFYFPATVGEVVASGRVSRVGILKRFGTKDKAAITHAMHVTNTEHLKDRSIGTLSGGQRQLVYIARSLASGPELLILDEPEVGVDVLSKEHFYAFLKHINSTLGITIMLASHDTAVMSREVESLMCINRKLFCYGPRGDFVNSHVFEQAYGSNVSSLVHRH